MRRADPETLDSCAWRDLSCRTRLSAGGPTALRHRCNEFPGLTCLRRGGGLG